METQWSEYCPNINLTCSADGDLELRIRRWYARYRFRVALRRAAINARILRRLRRRLAYAANCDESLVNVSLNDTDDSRTDRRRLSGDNWAEIIVYIATDSANDAYTVLNNLDDLYQDVGYNATNGTGSIYSEDEDISDSSYLVPSLSPTVPPVQSVSVASEPTSAPVDDSSTSDESGGSSDGSYKMNPLLCQLFVLAWIFAMKWYF